jgi:F-type H+-transporting ATPase subunit delta
VSNRLVARRYAKALADIAEKDGTLVEVQRELAAVSDLVRTNPDLERLAFYPLIPPAQKAKAFDEVLATMGMGNTVRRFFQVVTSAARLNLIHDLSSSFGEFVDERTGVLEARVQSAQALTGPQTQALEAALARRTGKTIRLQWHQEPSILGGVKVQVGSTVYDASIQGRLRLLKAKLLSV